MAEAQAAAHFNKEGFPIVDNYTYVFVGDGCLQEGVSSEACSLAGHLGLGKLVVLYDDNHITIDGETELSFTEDVLKRYEAYGWHVQAVADGNSDIEGLTKAIEAARAVTDKPSLIKVHTTIGFGSAKQGTEGVHGNPLGDKDLADVKKKFGFDPEKKFDIDEETRNFFNHAEQGDKDEAAWNALFAKYEAAHPDLAKEFRRRFLGKHLELPEGWEKLLPRFAPGSAAEATRKTSGRVLNALAKTMPELFGGSADLNPSCFTYLDGYPDFQKKTPIGRNIRFGVREHAMAAILNGLAAYGGYIPFGSTFMNFLGYAWGSAILSALSELRVIYVMTHDSIGLGEDGPTHQPIEKYMMVRETPHFLFLRPADGNETSGAYLAAISNEHRPSVISLSRQNVNQLAGTSPEAVLKGAYVLNDVEGTADVILVGSGAEVELCVKAKEKLAAAGHKARVVSFPSWELFADQSQEYQLSVFPDGVPILSVEAGSAFGWSRWSHGSIGMTSFGKSGPAPKVYEHFGFSVDNIAAKAQKLVEFYGKTAPSVVRRPF
jgi:transketolase